MRQVKWAYLRKLHTTTWVLFPARAHAFLKVETPKNRVALTVLGLLDYLKTIPPTPGNH